MFKQLIVGFLTLFMVANAQLILSGQKSAIKSLANSAGFTSQDLDAYLMQNYGKSIDELSKSDGANIIKDFQNNTIKKATMNYQSNQKPDRNFRKHSISIGLFDDKSGMSLIGYNYNIKLNKMNELFLGGGTSLIVTSISGGLKHYYKKSKLSFYSTLALDKSFMLILMPGLGGAVLDAVIPSFSFALDYNFSKWGKIKIGSLNKIFRTDSTQSNIFILPLGFICLDFQF